MSRPALAALPSAAHLRMLALSSILIVALAPAAMAAVPAQPQPLPYTISAVAGGGAKGTAALPFTAGASCGTGTLTATDAYGDGCLATQVLLSVPRAVAPDSQGNLFIVDSANVSIRRVDVRTGIITTIAGQGAAIPAAGAACASGSALTSSDAFGDGCLATQIKLNAPEGITVDAAGNVWFTDYNLGSVREIVKSTGIVNTIVNTAGVLGYRAGNVANPGTVVPAAQGMLVHPYGLNFDSHGILYIADNYNSVVDAVNLGTTAATVATISIPAGAIYTILGAGCTYGASTAGCSTYGKTGNGGPSTAATIDSPYQVAVDLGGNIYVADEYPYDVRVINGSTGIVTVFANSAFTKSATIVRGAAVTTSLASIYGVATDAYNNVYIGVYDSTTSSSYIDRVDIATGIVYPIAGQAVTTVPAVGGNAVGTGATICAARTDAVGDGCPGTQAALFKPFQPVVDSQGNVYVADQSNYLIRKVATGTGFPSVATGASLTQSVVVHFGAGDTPATASPYAIAAGYSDFTLGTAVCGAANSDTTTDCVLPVTFTPTAPGIRSAPITFTGTSGQVNVLSLIGNGLAPVLALDPATPTTLSATGLAAVSGISVDNAGNTYAAVPGSNTLVKLSATGVATTLGTATSTASAVAVDHLGNVFAALASGIFIGIPAPGLGTAQFPLAGNFTKPSGVAVDAVGNLYFADQSANTVFELLAGSSAPIAIATASSAGLNGPTGLAVDAFGNVFVANTIANTVVELPFNGSPAITLGSGLSSPSGVAVDAAGSLYIADKRNGRIVFIPNEAGTLNTADQIAIVSNLIAPSGVAVNGKGAVYVSDSTLNAIYVYSRSSAAIAFSNDPVANQLTLPADMVNVGNLPVTFAPAYTAATGNTGDFTLTPSTLGAGTSFPSGLGQALTAGFKPTVTGSRSAVYTFAATNTAAPTLTLNGIGITPTNATTTTIAATPLSGTYGQTVTATITIAVAAGLPAPTGTVNIKVDTTPYTPTLTGGVATLTLPALSAGTHTITAAYPGDTLSSPSPATPVIVTLAKAPLTVSVNSFTKAYYAALPTFTSVLTGVVNNDAIGIAYSTAATATSPIGTYPITATVSGTAVGNYTLTSTPGVLTIVKAATTTTVNATSTFVSGTTSVGLTATVIPPVGTLSGGVATGTVTFFNGSVQIGTPVTLVAGAASLTTTFPVVGGTTTNNVISAVYSGDTNFIASTSTPPLTIVSSLPGFTLTPSATTLKVSQGQSGLISFVLQPTFGYNGPIAFSCTGLPVDGGCAFSPATFTPTGLNTAATIAVSFTTVQPGLLAFVPVILLLAGFATRRRRLLGRMPSMLAGALLLLGLAATAGLSGCGTARSTSGTPVGPSTINVIATGAPGTGGGTVNIVQQFSVNLMVQ